MMYSFSVMCIESVGVKLGFILKFIREVDDTPAKVYSNEYHGVPFSVHLSILFEQQKFVLESMLSTKLVRKIIQ